jgi:hypothetical protein
VRLTRRQLFRLFGGAAALAALPACGSDGGDHIFTGGQLAALRAFADVIIPEDDTPGGAKLGAVEYIERLITAFDGDVPAIFAGGPFSDRAGAADNDFANFIELDRVADTAWRLRVLGSDAVGGAPNEDLLGPVIGLRARLVAGLDAALHTADKPIEDMSADERAALFDAQPDDFKDLLVELVSEAAFAAPEYGGNLDLAGWALASFEGDALPRGYSQWDGTKHVERPDAPLSTANPGDDPAPLDGDVDQLIATVVSVLGGRVSS